MHRRWRRMNTEEMPEDVKKYLKKQGLSLEELRKSREAHMERMKKLDPQLSAARAERIMEIE
jgi:hypothetical protein